MRVQPEKRKRPGAKAKPEELVQHGSRLKQKQASRKFFSAASGKYFTPREREEKFFFSTSSRHPSPLESGTRKQYLGDTSSGMSSKKNTHLHPWQKERKAKGAVVRKRH
ncbi:hypothetical protein CDAR_185061 [Caerostris darwini]|uniref:Uncharacterized protein n=1 Tax=Caerostris darwini TaxID=1538125 RepID=A0AAV4SNJ5_9ARAC|nr:hypothetical protein CDAR_185061 [Caerostris darwini]